MDGEMAFLACVRVKFHNGCLCVMPRTCHSTARSKIAHKRNGRIKWSDKVLSYRWTHATNCRLAIDICISRQ